MPVEDLQVKIRRETKHLTTKTKPAQRKTARRRIVKKSKKTGMHSTNVNARLLTCSRNSAERDRQ